MSARSLSRGPAAGPPPREGRSSRLVDRLLPLVIAGLVLAAFLPALQGEFVSWDDDANFVDNPRYRGLGSSELGWMWTTFHMGHYVPLSWMSLGLDYVLWGMDPFGYHLGNLLLHAANAVAVYFLARRILGISSGHATPGVTAFAALSAALLFAIHPLRVESVAWATERRDVLSGLFFLLAALGYLRRFDAGRNGRRWYVISLGLFLCALLSKASAVTLPAVLLILDVFPLRRLGGERGWWSAAARGVYLEKIPFLVPAAAVALLAPIALGEVPQLGLLGKIAVSAYSWAFYLWKTIAPVGLSPLYPMPLAVRPFAPQFLLAYGVIVALAVIAWRARRRRPGVPAALAAYTVVMLPLLGLHQNGPQIAADRYTYLAGPVLGLLAGAGLLRLRRPLAVLPAGLAAALFLALGVLTWKQTLVWRDSGQLWSHVLERGPESPIPYVNWGNLLAAQGRVDEAIDYYRRALAIPPESHEAHNSWGALLARLGKPEEAIGHFRRAVELRPEFDEAHNNWGAALAQQGAPAEAIERYRRALEIRPENAEAHINWGNALVRLGRLDEAVEHYRRAAEIHPWLAEAHSNWGAALAQQGRLTEAIDHFRRALDIDPGHPRATQFLERAVRLQEGKQPR